MAPLFVKVKIVVLPACAGVIPNFTRCHHYDWRFTRMRGGDPQELFELAMEEQFYPHARG